MPYRLVATIALGALILTACGHFQPLDASSVPGSDSRQLAAEWLATTSAYQAQALADQEITELEYNQALTAGKECLERSGFVVSALQVLPDGIRKDFIVSEPRKTAGESPSIDHEMSAAMSKVWEDCRSGYYGVVETVWLAQHVRLDEGIDTLKAELGGCLEDNGVQGYVPSMADHEVVDLISIEATTIEAWACRETFLIVSGATVIRPQ